MDIKKRIEDGCAKVAERAAKAGETEMRKRFAEAQYDGTNDVTVTLKKINDTEYDIVADGNATLFIEFGSGVHYNSGSHPLGTFEGVAGIGQFGKGQGSHDGWVYKGEPGTNGKPLSGDRVFTHGNPAAMPMYHAHKAIRGEAETAIKETFK